MINGRQGNQMEYKVILDKELSSHSASTSSSSCADDDDGDDVSRVGVLFFYRKPGHPKSVSPAYPHPLLSNNTRVCVCHPAGIHMTLLK